MQQPQQKRHKLLTIAKPNKQNAGRNKGKTLKTAAGYKSAMGGGYEEVGGLVFWVGQWANGWFLAKNAAGSFAQTHSHIQSKHSHITENAPAA